MDGNNRIEELENIISDRDKEIHELSVKNWKLKDNMEKMIVSYEKEKEAIYQSTSWKLTKPYRIMAKGIKKIAKIFLPKTLRKAIYILTHEGFQIFSYKLHRWICCKGIKRENIKQVLNFDEHKLEQQRKEMFEKDILFSIIVPLYNTPKNYLIDMIKSCQKQTYKKWELCLADGSDHKHEYVGQIVRELQANDSRILYKTLEKNEGISENTNAALDMATGNYIALLDHDDMLHPSALYTYMKKICEEDADFIYCDEITFEGNLKNIGTVHFKPDFAIDNLRANNYICHFSVFSKEILSKVGRFRKKYDGSQDHDMILRLTEQAKHIVHVPNILYFWRSHPGSVASDIGTKTYAIEAGKNAVLSHLERREISAEVESSKAFPAIFRIRYKLFEQPLISILIPNRDHTSQLSRCIESILSRSTYFNYEIIILESNSKEEKTFEYYHHLSDQSQITVLTLENTVFNHSVINNYGSRYAKGEYLVFLDSDVEIISPNWLEEMLMYAQREDVGAVGAKLYYPNKTVQHGGIYISSTEKDYIGYVHHRVEKGNLGYMGKLFYAQNFSAVSSACLMLSAQQFNLVGGFDENLHVAYSDVDLCIRLIQSGKVNVWTPYAEAYHYKIGKVKRKSNVFNSDKKYFKQKWNDVIDKEDPYYNTNLIMN